MKHPPVRFRIYGANGASLKGLLLAHRFLSDDAPEASEPMRARHRPRRFRPATRPTLTRITP